MKKARKSMQETVVFFNTERARKVLCHEASSLYLGLDSVRKNMLSAMPGNLTIECVSPPLWYLLIYGYCDPEVNPVCLSSVTLPHISFFDSL